eukprot:gene4331-7687_t
MKNLKTQEEFDKERLKRMTIIGAGQTPITHYIIYTLEKYYPGTATKTILKKMSWNILSAPILISISFSANVLLQKDKNHTDVIQKVKNDVLPTWLMGGCYWPFVNH